MRRNALGAEPRFGESPSAIGMWLLSTAGPLAATDWKYPVRMRQFWYLNKQPLPNSGDFLAIRPIPRTGPVQPAAARRMGCAKPGHDALMLRLDQVQARRRFASHAIGAIQISGCNQPSNRDPFDISEHDLVPVRRSDSRPIPDRFEALTTSSAGGSSPRPPSRGTEELVLTSGER
jgi:hypothetical protein